MTTQTSDYLTLREVSHLWGVSPGTARKRVRRYGIETFSGTDLRKVLIHRRDAERFTGDVTPRHRPQAAAR